MKKSNIYIYIYIYISTRVTCLPSHNLSKVDKQDILGTAEELLTIMVSYITTYINQLCADTWFNVGELLARWMIGKDGRKESGNSILSPPLDDDDDDDDDDVLCNISYCMWIDGWWLDKVTLTIMFSNHIWYKMYLHNNFKLVHTWLS